MNIHRNNAGQGRKNRINLSIPTEYEVKLHKLSKGCGRNMRPTTLAALIVCRALDDALTINALQNEFSSVSDYRVLPIRINGRTDYMISSNN